MKIESLSTAAIINVNQTRMDFPFQFRSTNDEFDELDPLHEHYFTLQKNKEKKKNTAHTEII